MYYSQYPRREKKQITEELETININSTVVRNTKNWIQKIVVPPLPPSNIVHCSIMDLDYDILVIIHLEGCHMDTELSIPITIGTLPIIEDEIPSAPSEPEVENVTNVLPTVPNPATQQIGWIDLSSKLWNFIIYL